MLQVENHALPRRKSLQSPEHLHTRLLVRYSLRRVTAWSVVRPFVQLVVTVDLYRRPLFTSPIPPQVIEADVDDNAVNPGSKGALEPEAIQLLVSL